MSIQSYFTRLNCSGDIVENVLWTFTATVTLITIKPVLDHLQAVIKISSKSVYD